VVEKDWKQASILMPVTLGDENLLGCQSINNNTGIVKTLALTEQLRVDLHSLVKESLRLMESTPESSSGLLTKVLFDTLETINPRHLTALLISDL